MTKNRPLQKPGYYRYEEDTKNVIDEVTMNRPLNNPDYYRYEEDT